MVLWQNGYMHRSEIPDIVVQFHGAPHLTPSVVVNSGGVLKKDKNEKNITVHNGS